MYNTFGVRLVGRKVKSRRPFLGRLGWLQMSSSRRDDDDVPHGPSPKKKYLIEPGYASTREGPLTQKKRLYSLVMTAMTMMTMMTLQRTVQNLS